MIDDIKEKLQAIADLLIDQKSARIIIPAQAQSTGYWFGGGNMVIDQDGCLYLVGRYRNHGDSRTGVEAGTRGLELAIFRSRDNGISWEKAVSWTKEALSIETREVLSIEGSALHFTESGVELFVSTENKCDYPEHIRDYQKPGTGYWGIKHLAADTVDSLKSAEIKMCLETDSPAHLHIKDPFVYRNSEDDLVLYFCHHPFNWSSSNTGYMIRRAGTGTFEPAVFDCFHRGPCWDVAISRGTAALRLPSVGVLANKSVSLFFYDGGECMRNLSQHDKAVARPRGYSCEELGGVGFFEGDQFSHVERLSVLNAAFVSPWGTGCSRYVDILESEDGYHVTWQQSQADLSQPLVHNFVQREKVLNILIDL